MEGCWTATIYLCIIFLSFSSTLCVMASSRKRYVVVDWTMLALLTWCDWQISDFFRDYSDLKKSCGTFYKWLKSIHQKLPISRRVFGICRLSSKSNRFFERVHYLIIEICFMQTKTYLKFYSIWNKIVNKNESSRDTNYSSRVNLRLACKWGMKTTISMRHLHKVLTVTNYDYYFISWSFCSPCIHVLRGHVFKILSIIKSPSPGYKGYHAAAVLAFIVRS